MDEMKITSRPIKALVSSVLKRVIKNKTGCSIDTKINDFVATISENEAHVHFDIDASMPKSELIKMLTKFGL